MDLETLFNKVVECGQIKPNRVKDIKSSVKQYSQILGYENPIRCDIDCYNLPKKVRNELIEERLTEASHSKLRNLKNNISFLLKLAYELNLIIDPSVYIKEAKGKFGINKTKHFASKKKRKNSERNLLPPYKIKYQDWNPFLKEEYEKYYNWATAPISQGRPAHIKKRPSTMDSQLPHLEALVGYLVNIKKFDQKKIRLNDIFDIEVIVDFESWFINERHKQVIVLSIEILKTLETIAKYYLHDKELGEQINSLKKTLGKPRSTYSKDEIWVSLKELEIIALSEYERGKKMKISPYHKNSGVLKALCMQRSLIIRLLVRCPMRQRNIRDMKLNQNLKLVNGKWIIEFIGEENKVALKSGVENVYKMNFPIDLQQQLEEFIYEYRPLLCRNNYENVFLNRNGGLYDHASLNLEIKKCVYSYTEKPLNIHMFRTIWATEFILKTKDFITASIRLNDRIETVLKHYSHLFNIDTEAKVTEFLKEVLI